MLTDKNATQFIAAIDPQPMGELGHDTSYRGYEDHGSNDFCAVDEDGTKFYPPNQVGSRVPVHEEWRFTKCKRTRYSIYDIEVTYGNGETKQFREVFEADLVTMGVSAQEVYGGMQTASTMPNWAVREWRVVTKVEVKNRLQNTILEEAEVYRWVWLVTVEREGSNA